MKRLLVILLSGFALSANASVVYTSPNPIDEFWTWTENSGGVAGDVLMKMTTGVNECPLGVYLKHSTFAKNLVSTSLAAYMAKKPVVFQVYNDSDRFWSGSAKPYCEIRAIRLPKE